MTRKHASARARMQPPYKDAPRKERRIFPDSADPVLRSEEKGSSLRYTYMFSFTFVPLVFHPLCPAQRKYKGRAPLPLFPLLLSPLRCRVYFYNSPEKRELAASRYR